MTPVSFFMFHVHQCYATHPEKHPTTPQKFFVQKQVHNHNALLVRSFAGHHLSAPESGPPDKCERLTRGFLSPFPEISSFPYTLPSTLHSPLTHIALRGNVRPLLYQEKHDFIMIGVRSGVERRVSILQHAPPRHYHTPAPSLIAPRCVRIAKAKTPHHAQTWRAMHFEGGEGVFKAILAVRCTHPSQTYRRACLLQEYVHMLRSFFICLTGKILIRVVVTA